MRQVLSGKSNDAGSVLGGQGRVVCCASLITVGRAPDHAVGQGTEVSQRLNGLMGRAILTETNGIVGGDPDGADLRQSRQTDGTSSVRNEVEESATIRQDGTIGGETVHDGSHAVLTDTVADVSTSVISQTGSLGLEVDSGLPASQVGTSQISGTTKELRQGRLDLAQDSLRQLASGNSRVLRGIDGEALLPAAGQVTLLAAIEVSGLVRELLGILGYHLVPLLLESSTVLGVLVVHVINLLGNVESLIGEAELLPELLDVVGLERRAVDTVGALVEGTEADGGSELDHGRLVLDFLALLDGGLHSGEIAVTVLDGNNVPAIRLIALDNILSEGAVGVAVDGDVVVVVDADQVAQLEVTGQGGSLTRDTFHQATVAEEAVCVVVNDVKSRLVEGGSSVSLSHGQANGIADTLTKGTGGDLNSGGIVGLRVARSFAADRLRTLVSLLTTLAVGVTKNFVKLTRKAFRSSMDRS